MNRRTLLATLGGGVAVATGGVVALRPATVVDGRRADGESIAVDRTLSDESVDYYPSNSTVRWAKRTDPSGPDDYRTKSFREYADRECASVASDAAETTVRDRLDGSVEGVTTSVSSEFFGTVVRVVAQTVRDGRGDPSSTPSVSLTELAAVAPKTVRATVRLDDADHRRNVPVFVDTTTVTRA